MKKIAMALVAVATVAACASTPAAPVKIDNALAARATKDIRVKLRDPASGDFQNFRAYNVANGEKAVCVSVNAANALGGKTGFRDTVIFYRGAQHVVFFDDPAAYECANLARGTSARM